MTHFPGASACEAQIHELNLGQEASRRQSEQNLLLPAQLT